MNLAGPFDAEMIQETKRILTALANGTHPFEGTKLPPSDAVNDVRVVRALFSALEMLRQAELCGGNAVGEKKRPQQKDFALTPEEAAAFAYSEKGIPVTEVTKRINALSARPEQRRLAYKAITGWLVEKGLLEVITTETGWKRVPTPDGNALGMRLEHRIGTDREYDVVLYSEEAQHFLLDNIDEICSFAAEMRKRRKAEKKRAAEQPSLPEDEDILRF